MLTRILLLLLYLLVAVGIVLLTGRRYLVGDRRRCAFVGLLLVLLSAGHVRDSIRLTYPFVRWGMYGKVEAPKRYEEYLYRVEAGPLRHYPFGWIAPIAPRAFMRRLDQLVRACRCGEADPVLDAVIQALADIHASRTGRPMTEFGAYDVERVTGSEESGPRTLRYIWRRRSAAAP